MNIRWPEPLYVWCLHCNMNTARSLKRIVCVYQRAFAGMQVHVVLSNSMCLRGSTIQARQAAAQFSSGSLHSRRMILRLSIRAFSVYNACITHVVQFVVEFVAVTEAHKIRTRDLSDRQLGPTAFNIRVHEILDAVPGSPLAAQST